MPIYRVRVRIYNEWIHDWEAPNQQAAIEMAYDESQPDIGPNDYIEIDAVEINPLPE